MTYNIISSHDYTEDTHNIISSHNHTEVRMRDQHAYFGVGAGTQENNTHIMCIGLARTVYTHLI